MTVGRADVIRYSRSLKSVCALLLLATMATFAMAAEALTANAVSPASLTHTVIGTTEGFAPPVVVVPAGDSLTFQNADNFLTHTLTSSTTDSQGHPLFGSPSVGPGKSAIVAGVASLAPGVYQFHCIFHPWMVGVLEILPTSTPVAGQQTEWPLYGADLANSRTVAGGPSATSVASLTQAWRVDVTDGDFTGTPVVSNGVAYVGSNGGVVRAIRATSVTGSPAGTVLWAVNTNTPTADPVDASLAVSGGTVYVPVAKLGSPYVLALDAATGATLWRSSALDANPDADMYGSPTVALDSNSTSGPRLLVLQGVSAVNGDPASPLRGSIAALDAASGAMVWQTFTVSSPNNGGAVWSTPAVDQSSGDVFIGTGNAYTGTADPNTDSILKLNLHDGHIEAGFQGTSGDVFSPQSPGVDFDFGASPNLFTIGTQSYVGDGQKEGTYWALNRSAMTPAWHTQLGPGSALGGILGSTAYDAGAQQIVGPISVPGYLWSVTAASGLPNWVTAGAADPLHWSPVAISNGVVYSLTTTGLLGAWLEASGTPLLMFPLNNTSTPANYALALGGGVSVADGLVIANTGSQGNNGSVVAFRAN